MSKTKLYLILAVALVFTLAYAAPAFAWTHGQFSATTDACAGCHVAHAAQAPKLLIIGPTQTDFCFYCHGNGGASAPYDVKDGFTVVGSTYAASTAGGFVRQFAGMAGGTPTFTTVSSRHNVGGLVGEYSGTIDPNTKVFTVPGSVYAFTAGTSGFVCASCHDPHAGGAVPTDGVISGAGGGINPRLLRKTVRVGDKSWSNLNVAVGVETMGTFEHPGTGSVESGVYKVTSYVDGSTPWCGSCHHKFDKGVTSGRVLTGGDTMYRHAFGFEIYTELEAGAKTLDKTPLEVGGTKGKIACLTCHRAHSTTVAAAGWAASWPRSEGGTSTTSALLRMDNRGVCWNCHFNPTTGAMRNLP